MGKNETMADTARRYWAKKQKRYRRYLLFSFDRFFSFAVFICRKSLQTIPYETSNGTLEDADRRCWKKILAVFQRCVIIFFVRETMRIEIFFLSEKNNSVSTWFAEWNRRNWFRTRREEEKWNRAIEDTTLEDTEKRYRRVSLLFCFSHERETIRSANFGEWPPSRTTRPGPARRHCRFRK